MNIILCYPPSRNYKGYGQDRRWLPVGVASLGAYINKHSPEYNIVLLDLFNFSQQEAEFEILKYVNYDDINIIGFTCLTEQRFSCFELCQKLKNSEKDHKIYKTKGKIYTVLGGAHAQIMAEQIINNYPQVDFIIKGEGEKALLNLVNAIPILTEETLKETRIIESIMIDNIDEIPHAIEGFKFFRTPIAIEDEAPIVFSRGCTDHCTFCSTTRFWKGYRSRSASNVFNEMLKYYTEYGITKFKFHDDASTADIENWKNLCKMIIEFEYKWEFEITARADQFDKELINLLKQAGCRRVCLGIESGDEELRKAMNKNLDIDLAKENIKLINAAGIETNLLFIVAYPGETEETIKETVNFIRETKPTMTCKQPLMIFPGTKIYRDCVKKGLIDDSYWLNDQPQPYYTVEANWNKINEWTNKINNASRKYNVLLCVPARQKEEIFKLHVESLNNLEIPEKVNLIRYFILHNSKNLRKYLKKDDCVNQIETDEKYKKDDTTHHWNNTNLKMITKIKNEVVKNAVKGGFDYIFWVDSDLVLNPKTLKSLFEADKKIISEIFWTDWINNGKLEPNCWDFDHYGFIDSIKKYEKVGIHQCGGTGACILVHTDVYKSGVSYTPIPNISFSNWEDRAFSIRAYVNNFEIFIDTKYPAFHIYRDLDIKKIKKDGVKIVNK